MKRLFESLVLAVLGSSAVILGACASVSLTEGEREGVRLDHLGLSPECDRLPEGDAARTLLGIGTRASIAAVTGYHDCQPLTRLSGSEAAPELSYGPITKLWAVRELATYTEDDFEAADAPGLPVAVITMEATSEGYPALGIENAEQCLYLRTDGRRWNAAVAECVAAGETPEQFGPRLSVVLDRTAGSAATDYPPVARWGIDRTGGQPYMGVRCGAAWCDIGPPNFRPAPDRCEGRAKGFCDEQILAIEQNGALVPAPGVRAVIRPARGAERLRTADFDDWTEVATVRVMGGGHPVYVEKFNYHPGLNRVLFRHRGADPLAGWEAMILSPGARDTAYRHVVLDRHDGAELPGAARWAWSATDESSWVPCPTGCCYVSDRPSR